MLKRVLPSHSPLIFLIFSVMIIESGFSQTDSLPPLPDRYLDSLDVREIALGSFSYQISSTNPRTKAYFDQGVQLKYAFDTKDAVLSFRQAWQADTTCAICYWGEAWSMGAYLNGKLSEELAPHALAAIRKAKSLEAYASPVEKALIDAMTVRYVEDFDPKRAGAQDTAYAEAMAKVYQQFPDDHDVATIYAEALFVLEPRRGTRDLNAPAVKRIHQILEKVLNEDITHPGACHLYIHATESTKAPEKALDCARILGDAIPGASHINHMPSHTYNELGLWGEAVKANIKAWQSDQKATYKEGFAIYPGHNLHMLLFAASMDGQGAIAMQAAKDYRKITDNSMYEVLTMIRFGRFDEVLMVTERPERRFPGGMWDFAQGYARLKTGETDFARLYLERVKKAASDTSKADFRGHKVQDLLQVAAGILGGEIYLVAGDIESAIVSFEGAVAREDSLRWDEPEPMPFAARHWLGAALLEAERYAEAERVYREDIADHPHNGWSLFGLLQALKAQGKRDLNVEMDFQESWQRSEIWLRSSRF
jgi:tetratricopeptide (TPR) repeat protein